MNNEQKSSNEVVGDVISGSWYRAAALTSVPIPLLRPDRLDAARRRRENKVSVPIPSPAINHVASNQHGAMAVALWFLDRGWNSFLKAMFVSRLPD